MTASRKTPEAIIAETISEVLSTTSAFRLRRDGGKAIVDKLSSEGFLVIHIDDLRLCVRVWARQQLLAGVRSDTDT